jgi:hypothetical protein
MTINRIQSTGFAQISNALLRDSRLSFRARGIIAMVMSHSGEWDAPRDWLVGQTDKEGREAVQTALNELTALGYRVVNKERQKDGTWRTVVDWYHTPSPRNPSPVEDDSVLPEDPTEGRVSRPPVHPTAGQPVLPPEHQNQNTNTIGDEAPPSAMTQFSMLPDELVKKRVARSKAQRGYAFDEWWAIVPKKVAKGAAERAYRTALTKTTHEVLMQTTRDLVGWNALGPRQYIPNPATWLNGERWADETVASIPQRGQSTSGVLIPDDNYRDHKYKRAIDFDA